MARLKMLKAPKKPKRSASIATKENWLKKFFDVKKENARRVALNKKSDELSKKIASIKM